jgi:FtsZ-interacting cell division protein ZipA
MAAQLDRFSADIDIQIGLNILSQIQPFAGTKLRSLAEAAGMAFDDSGHFVRRDDEGNVLYRLTNQAESGFSSDTIKALSTQGITFLLDVPRVAHGDRVFNQMLDIARRFADALHGSLVDDNRRPLSDGELDPIRRQVVEYQAAMASRNLPAGGHLALRLFS